MSSLLGMQSARHPCRDFSPRRRVSAVGIGAMVGFHLLVGYALVSGLATDIVQAVQKPLMASIVPEPVRPVPPPPPPPPPKIERVVERVKPSAPPPPRAAYVPPPDVPTAASAPAIAAVQSTAPAPAPPVQAPAQREPLAEVTAAPAPAPARTLPARSDAGVTCPGYQQSLLASLAGAYDRVGIAGVVKVQFRVSGNSVGDVAVISGPREYQRAVQSAVRRFQCQSESGEPTLVALDITFQPE